MVGHHRHQRQVDHHRPDRPYPAKAPGCDAQVGGNIGTAVLPAAAARPAGDLCAGAFVLPDRPDAGPGAATSAVIMNITPDHLDRHGIMETTPPSRRGCSLRQTPGDTAIIGVDDAWCRRIVETRTLEIAPRADVGRTTAGRRGERTRRHSHAEAPRRRNRPYRPGRGAVAARQAQLAERRRRAGGLRCARRWTRDDHCRGAEIVSRPCAPDGRGGQAGQGASSSTIPRRPTPTRRPAPWPPSRPSTGSPAAGAKAGGIATLEAAISAQSRAPT